MVKKNKSWFRVWVSLVVYSVVFLLVACNVLVYNVVVLLVVRELTAAITGSRVGSPFDFGAIFGKSSWKRKMDDH